MFEVVEKYKGKKSTVHVQIRSGYAKAINLDKATKEELAILGNLKHPSVKEVKPEAKATK